MSNREQAVNRIRVATTEAEVLDLAAVAQLLRVHPITVRRLRKSGRFPQPFTVGTGPAGNRWLRASVTEWMQRGGAAGVNHGLQVR